MFESSVDFLVKNRFQLNNVQTDSKTERKAREANGHEYVDLGLPSGTLWATCNVGASKPEDYGNYYAWGETGTKSTYDCSTYKYANGADDKLTKYCNSIFHGYRFFSDNLTELQSGDDPATANWGGGWQTPTKAQWEELLNNTTIQWTTLNGVKGRQFTSNKNRRTLFLPAAGLRIDDELYSVGLYGYYWSSSLYKSGSLGFGAGGPSNSWSLIFSSDECYLDFYLRFQGFSVRPVRQN